MVKDDVAIAGEYHFPCIIYLREGGNPIGKMSENFRRERIKWFKKQENIKRYKIDSKTKGVEITLGEISECKAIKPRFTVNKNQIEKYRRRYLPSRNFGTVILSTNKGLMTYKEAQKEQIGGCLIAYFY